MARGLRHTRRPLPAAAYPRAASPLRLRHAPSAARPAFSRSRAILRKQNMATCDPQAAARSAAATIGPLRCRLQQRQLLQPACVRKYSAACSMQSPSRACCCWQLAQAASAAGRCIGSTFTGLCLVVVSLAAAAARHRLAGCSSAAPARIALALAAAGGARHVAMAAPHRRAGGAALAPAMAAHRRHLAKHRRGGDNGIGLCAWRCYLRRARWRST